MVVNQTKSNEDVNGNLLDELLKGNLDSFFNE